MTSDSERKSVKATVTPRKDNTGPKPLLTRREIEASKIRSDLNPAWCRTIEAMAKLLERVTKVECEQRLCGVVQGYTCLSCEMAQEAERFLATFNATGGEGSCLPESK